ncbi:MAG: hypothetical protein ACREBS_06430 [Nitrososphaerales archaeon]
MHTTPEVVELVLAVMFVVMDWVINEVVIECGPVLFEPLLVVVVVGTSEEVDDDEKDDEDVDDTFVVVPEFRAPLR